jgi:putative endonuclease
MANTNNYVLGNQGEKLALENYLDKGYKLITQNFQYYKDGVQGRLGELDLIMEKDKKIYVIEVKTRSDDQYGKPIEQITRAKLNYIYKTFQYFLLKNRQYQSYFCQFDVACITGNKIEIIPNAYSFESLHRY